MATFKSSEGFIAKLNSSQRQQLLLDHTKHPVVQAASGLIADTAILGAGFVIAGPVGAAVGAGLKSLYNTWSLHQGIEAGIALGRTLPREEAAPSSVTASAVSEESAI